MRRHGDWCEGRPGPWGETIKFLVAIYLRVGDGGVAVISEGEVIRVPASKLV